MFFFVVVTYLINLMKIKKVGYTFNSRLRLEFKKKYDATLEKIKDLVKKIFLRFEELKIVK